MGRFVADEPETPPFIPDWKAIFQKTDHEFTVDEMEAAGYNDRAILAVYKPEFWKKYKTQGPNSKNLQDIWDLEYEWYQLVNANQFQLAKNVYKRLLKVTV